jgi:Ca2+-transporting ATPase
MGEQRSPPGLTVAGVSPTPPPWHALEVSEVLELQGSSLTQGLSEAEAAARLARGGPNALEEAKPPSLLRVFASQFMSPLIFLLIVAAVIALVVGERTDAAVVMVVLLVNASVGTMQERRAERSMASLKRLSTTQVRLRRGGRELLVPSEAVVPGDLLVLAAGDAVAADARVVHAVRLACAEAALTGESVPVAKASAKVAEAAPLGDRASLVHSGTVVTAGRGLAVVVATGGETQVGRLARLTEGSDGPTPLEVRLKRLGKVLAVMAVALFGLVLVAGWLRSLPMGSVLMVGISQLVSVVPEGLPVALTIGLAVGMRRMAQRRAIVRHLAAVETLGGATVICTDKTGTLTKNEMTVTRLWLPDGRWVEVSGLGYRPKGDLTSAGATVVGDPALTALLEAGALCNDASLLQEGEAVSVVGDPTEGALVVVAEKAGVAVEELRRRRPRLSELPFDAEARLMATANGGHVFVKGSAEAVLALCPDAPRAEILAASEALAAGALRVLAVARCSGPLAMDAGFKGLHGRGSFLGLLGQLDPPREEVADAVRRARTAGIRLVMVTGDHKVTGLSIARTLGIAGPDDEAMEGAELAALSSEELARRLDKVAVFARVQPEQKLRLIEAFQAKGAVVAMTGDGVNDAPALVRADVGLSMGKSGTEVARQASDIVITDDDFATIIAAVEEGRVVYANLKKVTLFLLTSSFAESIILLLALATGLPMPFVAVQILWNNLVTEGTITVNLVMEPREGDELLRAPIPPSEPLLTKAFMARLLYLGFVMAGLVYGFFAWRLGHDVPFRQVQSETFTLLAVVEWFNVLNCRSERRSALRLSLFTNLWLLGGLVLSNLLQAAVIFIPALNSVFKTQRFSLQEVIFIGTIAAVMLLAEEVRKFVVRRVWPLTPRIST